MAKDISAIFMTEEEIEAKAGMNQANETLEDKIKIVKREMLNKYNAYMNSNLTNVDNLILEEGRKKNTNKLYQAICAYYEYMQFKRGIFKCTNLSYDMDTGRVNKLDFEFTGNIH